MRHFFDEISERAKFPSLAKEGWLRPSRKCREASLAGADGVVGSSHRLSVVEQTTPAAPSKEGVHFLDGAAFLYASPYRARASRPPWLRRGVLFAALWLSSSLAFSQSPGTSHPDLSGYWELRYDSFNVQAASLTPQAAADQANQRRQDTDAVRWCINVGVPALMGDRSALDLRQSPTVIGMVAKAPSSVRYIYTDGRPHPDKDDLDPTTNGHSIGHWEGDTLVVDTIGFNDRGVRSIPGGGLRTPNSHLTERYRLLEGGQRLSVTFTWEDAGVFQKPHTYEFRYYRVRQISEPRVFTCNPNDAERAKFLLDER